MLTVSPPSFPPIGTTGNTDWPITAAAAQPSC